MRISNKLHVSQLKPLGDRVVVMSDKLEEVKTTSGIIIPETAQEKPLLGTVVAVGPGLIDSPMPVAVGDRVMYGKYAGNVLPVSDEEYLMIRVTDIMTIVLPLSAEHAEKEKSADL